MQNNKLHIGCGKRFLPGWVHIDLEDFKHIDYKTTCYDLHMVKDNTIDTIYASHILEYFDLQEAKKVVLPEWRRVLKPKGELLLAVPDFEAIAKLFLAGIGLERFLGPLYGKIKVGEKYLHHKTVYDMTILKKTLEECGFKGVQKCDLYRHLNSPKEFDDYSKSYIPHMDFESGVCISLNVIGYKHG